MTPEQRRRYYLANREKEIAQSQKWRTENRDRWNARRRQFRFELRARALAKFETKCLECGFDDPRALQIDHVNNDGKNHRKEPGVMHSSTNKFFREVLSDTEGRFQCLCANHNWIKHHETRRK